MKILYISSSEIPSTAANSVHVMKMCRAFAGNGHAVRLLTWPAPGMGRSPGADPYTHYGVENTFSIRVAPYNIGRMTNKYLGLLAVGRNMLFAARQVLGFRPDLVYGRELSGCLTAARLGRDTMFEAHGPVWTARLERRWFKSLAASSHFKRLVVISQALKDMYLEQYPDLDPDKVLVAHDGADPHPDFDPPGNWLGRKGALQVGYLGSLYKGRGISLILALADSLSDMDFHCVGGTEEDIARWKAEGERKNVFFHGHVPPGAVYTYRNGCDVLLAPYQDKVAVVGGGDTSRYMSPLKIFEYMAAKKPIIASDLPAIREVLGPGNAVLAPFDSVDAWKNALEELRDPARRQALAEAAHAEFLARYTWGERAKTVIS